MSNHSSIPKRPRGVNALAALIAADVTDEVEPRAEPVRAEPKPADADGENAGDAAKCVVSAQKK